jgi:site-specific DNA-methyltransferase (adenine-specific)
MDEVPVIYVSDLSDVQLKKYRILDNKLSDIAKWDIENLRIELEDI